VAAEQAASARAASIVSAHTASQIVSIVTVLAADHSAAMTVTLAVASDALRRPVVSQEGSRTRRRAATAASRRKLPEFNAGRAQYVTVAGADGALRARDVISQSSREEHCHDCCQPDRS
jgi:hypothetical protein